MLACIRTFCRSDKTMCSSIHDLQNFWENMISTSCLKSSWRSSKRHSTWCSRGRRSWWARPPGMWSSGDIIMMKMKGLYSNDGNYGRQAARVIGSDMKNEKYHQPKHEKKYSPNWWLEEQRRSQTEAWRSRKHSRTLPDRKSNCCTLRRPRLIPDDKNKKTSAINELEIFIFTNAFYPNGDPKADDG